MALINCPECKNKVSDKANACPHCGFPIEEYLNNIKKHGEHKMSMEFDVSVDDNDEKYIKNINGIKVNLGNLLLSKNFEVSSSCKTLCSITKIGIVESKSII